MQNGDEALPSIILAGRGILVKMLITFEPYHIFWSKFAYIYIFLKMAVKKDKEKKIHTCILVRPGVEPLCDRLLDYKKATQTIRQRHIIHTRAIYTFTCTGKIKISWPLCLHHVFYVRLNLHDPGVCTLITMSLARPLSMHYNLAWPWVCTTITMRVRLSVCLSVCLSAHGKLVKWWYLLINMKYFDQILHIDACQHYLTTGMSNSLFDGRDFAEHHFSWLITLEPQGIYGSNFAYWYILKLSSDWYAKWWQAFAEHLFGWSRSFSEILKTLELHHILWSHFAYLKLAGKMTKKRKIIKKIYWSRLDSNHCASG